MGFAILILQVGGVTKNGNVWTGQLMLSGPDLRDNLRGDDMGQQGIELMAHLMRRAGFGATRDELDPCPAKGYEATVERLLSLR